MDFACFVEGIPAASRSRPSGPRYVSWSEALDASLAGGQRILGPYRVELAFILPRDHSEEANHVNPDGADIDNLSSAVLDALERAVILTNDGRVAHLTASKRRARGTEASGAHIRVAQSNE